MKILKQPWTPENLKRLKTLRAEGLSNAEIAIALGRSLESITARMKRDGIASYPAPTAPVNIPKPEAHYEEDRARVSDEVWKARYSALSKKYEKAIKENSVVESLVAEIKTQAPLSYSDAPPVVLTDRKGSRAQSAVLLFSDTHVGQVISPEQTLGFGEYNFDIFLARLKYLEESTISILTRHTTTKIDELVLPMLGDFLHGALNHAAEAAQHVTMFTQYYSAGHAIAQFIRNLAAYVPSLRIHTVVGNHTRWGTQKKMPTENRYSNLDMFLYALVEALTHDIKNVKWNLNMQPFAIFEVQGFTFHASHGDHLRGGDKALGIPNHAFGRQLSTTAQLFAKHEKQSPHYYVTGHLHRGIQLPHALGEIIVNGGFPGLDNYALAENFNPVDAMQRLLFMHPKFGRTAEYPLSLKFAERHDEPPYTIPATFPTA